MGRRSGEEIGEQLGAAIAFGIIALGEWAQRCSRPLTGRQLAERHGFEPVPDWAKDPFVRPMRGER